MAVSNSKATFSCDIEKMWKIITSVDDYTWRSDLSKVEVLENGKKFIEYTNDGYSTTFTVTKVEPLKRWEFDIENSNITGHWVGLFSYQNGVTTIDFTENISVKKLIMKPFAGMYLKKQQKTYIENLRKACSEMPD